MKKKLLVCLLVAVLILVTGCKEKDNEPTVKEHKNKVQIKKDGPEVITNESLGELYYFIPSDFTLNDKSTEVLKTYEKKDDRTDITIIVAKKENVSGSLEDYMKNDAWKPDITSLDKLKYNNQEWYVEDKKDFMMYTKYNDTVYQIKINASKDASSYFYKLITIITNSVIFK